jgi:hypothetical protein
LKILTFAFVFAALAFTAPARAETVNCTAITTLPAVITVQGIYCFTGNLATAMTTGSAIEIQTNNVVLDLNGFKLGGLAAGPSTNAIGIFASDRQNITIKNGTVRGFGQGILLDSTGASQGHVVEDIRADQNTVVGINVHGSGNIVRNNQVVATGGSTCCADSTGILVQGAGARVVNNDVINMINLAPGFGTARGIFFFGANGGLAVNNRITVADKGIEFVVDPGKYRDNLTFGVPTATRFVGGTAVGIND